MAMKIILKILAILFFTLFLFLLYGMALGIYNGTAKNLVLFLELILNPKIAFDNSLGAMNIFMIAFLQFIFAYAIYFVSKKLWKKSKEI